MPPRVSWSNLLPGLIALAVMISLAVGLVLFGGIGRLRGDTMRLYVLTNQARGVIRGSPVWLEGQKVGVVDRIDFRRPGLDTSARVVIVLSVRVHDAEQIRRDSRAVVRAGGNIIGPVVVYLEAGTPRSPGVRDGDTLRAGGQSDMELAGVKVTAAMDELGPLMADARTVMAHARDPNGTVGAVMGDRRGGEIARLRTQVTQLRAKMFGGAGVASKTSGVMTHARSALARADSIRGLVNSPNTSLGRFRRDSTLGATIAGVRDELAEIRVRLGESEGTLGRFSRDSAVTRAVEDARREMARLFDDFRRRPARYINY